MVHYNYNDIHTDLHKSNYLLWYNIFHKNIVAIYGVLKDNETQVIRYILKQAPKKYKHLGPADLTPILQQFF